MTCISRSFNLLVLLLVLSLISGCKTDHAMPFIEKEPLSLWDLDIPGASPLLVESWSTEPEVVKNPYPEHENLSDSVIRWAKPEGTWHGLRLTLDKTLDLENYRYLVFKVYSDRASLFQLAMKSTQDYLEPSRLRALSLPGYWHEVCFDLGEQLTGRYDILYLFVDEENPVPGVYFLDDFRLTQSPPVASASMRKDNEDSSPFILVDPDQEGALAKLKTWDTLSVPMNVENPLDPGSRCWMWIRPGGSWQGFGLHLPGPADLTRYSALEIDMISPRDGHIHLMANSKGEKHEWLRSDQECQSAPGQWKTTRVSIPDLYREAGKFQVFHLFINREDQPADTFYIKQIRLVK